MSRRRPFFAAGLVAGLVLAMLFPLYWMTVSSITPEASLFERRSLLPRSAVTDQQFPVNKIVTEHFIAGEKPVEFARVRFGSSQETDPYRCINKDHLCTAALAPFSTPRHVARRRIGSA